jgi:hypothetical protein
LVDVNVFETLRCTARPNHFYNRGLGCRTETDRNGQFGLRKVTSRRHHLPPERFAIHEDFDPGADAIAIVLCAHQFQAQPVTMQVLLVAQQQWSSARLCEHYVEIAVAVDIGVS